MKIINRFINKNDKILVRCSHCKKYFEREYFGADKKERNGIRKWCKSCEKEDRSKRKDAMVSYNKKYRRTVKGYWSQIKNRMSASRIKRERYKVEMEYDDFEKWFNTNELKCAYCGFKGDESYKIGIDRKNASLPYSIDNIVFCCYVCNTCKSNVFSYEEFKEIAEKYLVNKKRDNLGRVL